MIKLLWSGLLMMLVLTGCGWNGTPTRNNDFTPLTSIEIVAVSSIIAAQTSTQLTVKGNFSGLYTRDITSQAVWSSDSPTVAEFSTASSPNRVTGKSPGVAVLTAVVGNVSASYSLTVSSAAITALTITPVAPSVPKGLTTQFAVSGTFSDSTTQDLTFDAVWASSAPGVATVGDAAANKGFAQALAVGATTISATFGGMSGTALLTITEAVLQSIIVSSANSSLLTLSAGSFQSVGHYSDGSSVDITSQAAWTSSRTDIATIAGGGAVKTLLQGTSTISASLNGVSGASNLKVTGGNLTGITISPANFTIVKDSAERLTATGSFSNGTSRDITGLVEWSVANTSIANVTAPVGNLTWLSAIATTPASTPIIITAKSGAITATTNLTVTAPLLQAITISPTSLDIPAGTSARFIVTAKFADNTTQDVTVNTDWTSGAPATATAGNVGLAKGRVSGIVAGSTTISALYGGITVTAPVTVSTRTIQSLALNAAINYSVSSGNQVSFTATANYSDGSSKAVTEDTIWSVDKPNIAILADNQNQPGQVVAVDTGSATLTADFGGKSQTLTVLVP